VTKFLVFFSKCSTLFSKNWPKLSLDRNSSPNRLGHSLTLEVNSLLRVIGVSFQLYGQLKKSPYNGTGVLGSSTVLTASQTTRLGKGSSVTTRNKPVPTCLVHNCETSRGLVYFHLLSPLSQDQIPFDPHHCVDLFLAQTLQEFI